MDKIITDDIILLVSVKVFQDFIKRLKDLPAPNTPDDDTTTTTNDDASSPDTIMIYDSDDSNEDEKDKTIEDYKDDKNSCYF